MSRYDKIALLFSLLAVIAGGLVANFIFQDIPHLEDEFAYAWQAQVIAGGRITLPSPPHPREFLVPFVVDFMGQRFGKYPLGWPIVLAAGVKLGVRWLVNPLLSGLAVWLTYLLGKRIFDEKVGLLAAGLTLTSPFFLVNSGSLLSHPLSLALSASFTLAWLDGFGQRQASRRWLVTLSLALLMGALILTRPLTALAVALPFAVHSLYLLTRGSWQTRLHLLAFALLTLALAGLHLLWQYALTGDPLMNPYVLWWPYDKFGFGIGMGVEPGGHSLRLAYDNTVYSLNAGWRDFFGWGGFSWLFLPFGLWAARRSWQGLMLAGIFPSLVLLYAAYWVGAALFGPRYYYEALPSVTIISAAGILWMFGRLKTFEFGLFAKSVYIWGASRVIYSRIWRSAAKRPNSRVYQAAILLICGLFVYNLAFYLPGRLQGMYSLYEINAAAMQPFLTPQAQAMTPAMVIVHAPRWMYYGNLLPLENPYLTSPFIFVYYGGNAIDNQLPPYFPNRKVYHYYTDDPGKFYTQEKAQK